MEKAIDDGPKSVLKRNGEFKHVETVQSAWKTPIPQMTTNPVPPKVHFSAVTKMEDGMFDDETDSSFYNEPVSIQVVKETPNWQRTSTAPLNKLEESPITHGQEDASNEHSIDMDGELLVGQSKRKVTPDTGKENTEYLDGPTLKRPTPVRASNRSLGKILIPETPVNPAKTQTKKNGPLTSTPNYEYVEVVRSKDERKKMHAFDCPCCKTVECFYSHSLTVHLSQCIVVLRSHKEHSSH